MARKSAKKIISVILVLALLAGAFAGVAILLKKSFDDMLPESEFYVSVDGKDVYSKSYGYVVFPNNDLNVSVKSSSEQIPEYTTAISVDPSVKFTFVKDGQLCLFLSSEDVSSFFDIQDTDNGFVVSCNGKTVTDMLKTIYETDSISVEEQAIDYNSTMFWLTIQSKDNADAVIKIGFSLFGVMRISFENEGIIF